MNNVIEIEDQDLIERLSANNREMLKFLDKVFELNCDIRGSSFIYKKTGNRQVLKRNNAVSITPVKLIEELLKSNYNFSSLSDDEFKDIIWRYINERTKSMEDILKEPIIITSTGKKVFPRTENQYSYIKSMKNNSITVGIGPAGTGKTYLAIAVAMNELFHKKISKLVLTRPTVEAGENLGFLPGDIEEKINPYLRPLYDSIYDFISTEQFKSYFENGVIEVIPLAYMRGRTLSNSFIILDEAQNSSSLQMKMFLTRLGTNSKIVITGDITQIDLKNYENSGLIDINNKLQEIDDICFVYFSKKDVIRHPLVKKIIAAYDKV